ncbi:hexitol phosphatase HxpB [Klebsiella sp. BIGb0407]|uniref:hexitol phosphatase HxpB n=1 Tax=Klebsiella sp. BIGb0407 TaxID=2940603 RepID=UPI002168D0FC|nr:hexitol phosphatase HxpB [Klebsiella sp. BIGb0407]MCS3429597.1 sugar-phosphatase [Klebsiella sp. BIGb0407]
MASTHQIHAAIFDMDGLLIDSEPLWEQAEHEILSSIGVDTSRHHELPETLGVRIDVVVDLWFNLMPWAGPSCAEVTASVIKRVIELVEQQRPLKPGVREALILCKARGLKIGLASASPLAMLEKVLEIFELREYFDTLASAEHLPYSKPHPQVYLNAAAQLNISPVNCVALEDSVTGMVASKAARMRSIVVPLVESLSDPRWGLAEVKISSLEQLTASNLTG